MVKGILSQVLRHEHIVDVWAAIDAMLSSISRLQVTHQRKTAANTKKNGLSITQDVTRMKARL
jgi:hypothetical protein